MKSLFFIVLVSFSVWSGMVAATANKTDVHYGGHVFSVPVSPYVIALLGSGEERALILRYGEVKGEKYLAFSGVESNEDMDYGCAVDVFFNALFTGVDAMSCNSDVLEAFAAVFIRQHVVGKWEGNTLTAYFSMGDEQSFVFLLNGVGAIIKIDSDFLSKEELKTLVENAL